MKKIDWIWGGAVLAVLSLMAYPVTREAITAFTAAHAYVAGFIKFGVLATMGELLAVRIASSDWSRPPGLMLRTLIWGFLGMAITLFFTIFSSGVGAAAAKGLLPGGNNTLAAAFFTSLMMNLTFGPAMMTFHRLTDTYLNLRSMRHKPVPLAKTVAAVDWEQFFSLVIFRTIPLFWIPAHTITFLLPPEYRVFMAAALSMALGLILALAKTRQTGVKPAVEE